MEEIVLDDRIKEFFSFLVSTGQIKLTNDVEVMDVWNEKVFNYIYEDGKQDVILEDINNYLLKLDRKNDCIRN